MKYSLALLSAVGAVVAQELGSLPACGQTCVSNMVAIASSSFGCAAGDVNCYCSNMDFGYGVRDCSNEACGSAEEAAQVISYGTNYCAQALGDAASSAGSPAGSVLSSALTEAGATPTGGDEGVQSTPITTSPLAVTTVVDGQTQVQTTGFVTLFGPANGAASSQLSDAASDASDALNSASSVLSSITGALSPTPTDDDGASQTTTTDSAPAESSGAAGSTGPGEGAAPLITAAPVIGAGALAAALFLI